MGERQIDKAAAPRTPEEMKAAQRELIPVKAAGYRMFPLGKGGKIPRDKGWQRNEYTVPEIVRWLRQGGNIGIVLGAEDLVVDVDPRHGGDEALERLEADLNIDLSSAPAVLSGRGDGGRHIYFRKPAGLRVAGGLEGFKGIDIKTTRGLVVAPGSRHPDTGGMYRHDPRTPPLTKVAQAPQALLDAIARRESARRRGFGGGELSVAQLEMLLGALDPSNYGHGRYDRWIRLAAACHDATNGEGLDVWLDWAARDESYGADADELNRRAWESFTAGRPGGASYITLLREVARAGRPDLATRVEPGLVFDDDERPDLDFSAPSRRLSGAAFRGTK